jgi:hypothetical protein
MCHRHRDVARWFLRHGGRRLLCFAAVHSGGRSGLSMTMATLQQGSLSFEVALPLRPSFAVASIMRYLDHGPLRV